MHTNLIILVLQGPCPLESKARGMFSRCYFSLVFNSGRFLTFHLQGAEFMWSAYCLLQISKLPTPFHLVKWFTLLHEIDRRSKVPKVQILMFLAFWRPVLPLTMQGAQVNCFREMWSCWFYIHTINRFCNNRKFSSVNFVRNHLWLFYSRRLVLEVFR